MIRNVAVAVSGGVDSTVAALLIRQKGFNTIGVFMRNWDENDEHGLCSTTEDYSHAKYVCDKIGIPFYELNFVKNYWTDVFTYLIHEYENGFTPNPDIMCNRNIKFKAFMDRCFDEFKVDAIATGHYARTSYGPYLENACWNTPVKLLAAKDSFKDQTFFLSQVEQCSLRRVMFPIGDMMKEDVKIYARKHGLTKISQKKESTGICFVGKRKFQDFIREYIPNYPGPIVHFLTGCVIGQHDGLHMWTLGQCCHISGFKDKLFITAKDVSLNTLFVVPGTNHPALFTKIVYTAKPHWLTSNPIPAEGTLKCQFRFQHTKPCIGCEVAEQNFGLIILLEQPLKAVTPGQFAVLYEGEECLGSARIERPGPTLHSLKVDVPENYKEYHHFLVNI